MDPVTTEKLNGFLHLLGEDYPGHATFYLLGGSALMLLGNTRQTLDIDFTTDLAPSQQQELENIMNRLAGQFRLDVESVPIGEFIPLPSGYETRRRFIGQFGNLDVYLFDLYTIALSKIARGFDSDLEDVVFLIRENLINLPELEKHFKSILPMVSQTDISAKEFKQYFQDLLQRWNAKP